jgi:hypothetical protein
LRGVEAAGGFDAKVTQQWAAEFETAVFLRRMRAFVLERVPAAAGAIVSAESLEGLVEVL